MADRNTILNNLDIEKKDWVLEIGGGPAPFMRSDVLADKYLSDNTERADSLIVDRPTVICDAHYLPFVDDSFDYVFCSQLLEHLERPELFFKEIARIGKRGYIETPNEIRERLFGWPFHKWIVDKDNDGLVLRENHLKQAFGLFFHMLQKGNFEFSRFCSTAHDLLNICYEWHGKPTFRFSKESEYKLSSQKVSINADDVRGVVLSKPYKETSLNRFQLLRLVRKQMPKKLKHVLKRQFYSPPYGYRHSEDETHNYLLSVLACPICKSKVSIQGDEIVCPKCERHDELTKGIPFMLAKSESGSRIKFQRCGFSRTIVLTCVGYVGWSIL